MQQQTNLMTLGGIGCMEHSDIAPSLVATSKLLSWWPSEHKTKLIIRSFGFFFLVSAQSPFYKKNIPINISISLPIPNPHYNTILFFSPPFSHGLLKASGWPIGGKRNIKSNNFWFLNSLESNKITVNVDNNARNVGKTQKMGLF